MLISAPSSFSDINFFPAVTHPRTDMMKHPQVDLIEKYHSIFYQNPQHFDILEFPQFYPQLPVFSDTMYKQLSKSAPKYKESYSKYLHFETGNFNFFQKNKECLRHVTSWYFSSSPFPTIRCARSVVRCFRHFLFCLLLP